MLTFLVFFKVDEALQLQILQDVFHVGVVALVSHLLRVVKFLHQLSLVLNALGLDEDTDCLDDRHRVAVWVFALDVNASVRRIVDSELLGLGCGLLPHCVLHVLAHDHVLMLSHVNLLLHSELWLEITALEVLGVVALRELGLRRHRHRHRHVRLVAHSAVVLVLLLIAVSRRLILVATAVVLLFLQLLLAVRE